MNRLSTGIRWYNEAWSGHPWAMALLTLGSFANAALAAASPWLWQRLVGAIEGDSTDLWRTGVWLLIVGLGQSAVYCALQWSRTWMNSVIQRRTRRVAFAAVSRSDRRNGLGIGDVVARLLDDAGEKSAWFLCSGVFRTLDSVLVLLFCGIAAFLLDPVLTAGLLVPLPLLLILQTLAQRAITRRAAAAQDALSGCGDEIASTFGGIRVVQAAGLGPGRVRAFRAASERQRRADLALGITNQLIGLIYGYGWQLAAALVLGLGGYRVVTGDLDLARLVALEGLVASMVWPMFDFAAFVSRGIQASVAFDRLDELIGTHRAEPDLTEVPDARPIDGGGLAARRLSVVAEDGRELICDIELEVASGRMLAVVGEIGSGKSTLLRALAGAIPSTGAIELAGAPIGAIGRGERRASIAWVPQDAVLLSAPLRDNVTLGRSIDEPTLDAAIAISRLSADLPQLASGLDTRVGERGTSLSGGQQQRAALARALVGRPRVLLLDDTTAALDAATEADLWAALERTLPECASVVVTHRAATLRRADAVIVLEGGRVAQRGRHDELVAVEGPYRRIYGRAEHRDAVVHQS